jgi:hypothetical protein
MFIFTFLMVKNITLEKAGGYHNVNQWRGLTQTKRVVTVLVDSTGVIFAVFKQQIPAVLKNINNHFSCGL